MNAESSAPHRAFTAPAHDLFRPSVTHNQYAHHKEINMNSDQLKGKWKQVKGQAREKWGRLTNDDLDVIDGKAEQLAGKIQERYGKSREEAEKEVEEFCSTCQC